MKFIKRNIYSFIKKLIKAYLKIFMEFKVWGRENIPEGPKIFCSNHFSSTDPFFVLTLFDEPIHMVIGPGFTVPILKHIIKAGEQIDASGENKRDVVENAVSYLKKGESVYIFPEGALNDQTKLLKFYNGVAKIQKLSKCPIVPIGIVSPKRYIKEKKRNIKEGEIVYKTLVVLSGKYYANIGTKMEFEEKEYSYDEIIDILKKKILELIEDIKVNKFWE